jgi:uncharacterized protein YjbI with pentapeptide repeats
METPEYGTFAGKWVFGSAGTVDSTFYMTEGTFEETPDKDLFLPVMDATEISVSEYCTIYQAPDGMYIQLSNSMWIALYESLGWLYLTPDFNEASKCNIDLSTEKTTLQVQKGTEFKTVYYTVDNPSPILTINSADSAFNSFQLTKKTPTLEQIRSDKGCSGGNFTQVNFKGEDLSELNFSKADFCNANLSESNLTSSDLSLASLISTDLKGINLDQAILDQADMSECDLTDTDWGQPNRAIGLRLIKCRANGATLGHKGSPMNCTGAILTNGKFHKADLQEWNLSKAILGEVEMTEATLTKVILDQANLVNGIFTKAKINHSSLKNVIALRANFIGANLDFSNLHQGQFSNDDNNFLFRISDEFIPTLDDYKFPQQNLIDAFEDNGVTLSSQSPITVINEGTQWSIGNEDPSYLLTLDADKINVFLQSKEQVLTAVFTGASCHRTEATSANFYGVNMQGVQWYGEGAALDDSILENADLSNALLLSTNFTQAKLAGCNLSNSILIGCNFEGCTIKAGAGNQPCSFQHALMQGMNFKQSTLSGILMTGSSISMAEGVPLFPLPLSDEADLTPENLSRLQPQFEKGGNPLNDDARITPLNPEDLSKDTITTLIKQILEGEDHPFLNVDKVRDQIAAIFKKAEIKSTSNTSSSDIDYWLIGSTQPSDFHDATYYPLMLVHRQLDSIEVSGIGTVLLRDWSQYDQGADFGETIDIQAVINSDCIGPNGEPQRMVANGLTDWTSYFTSIER